MAEPAPRILIIEDEAPIRRFLRIVLEGAKYTVDEAARGRLGVEMAATGAPDAILLDLGLPDIDGKQVIADVRQWTQTPILILSVRNDERETIAALDAGADDYLTKPFATGEMLARLRVLLRRHAPGTAEPSLIRLGPLTLDLATRQVQRDDVAIALTRKEFDVLALLLRNPGRLLTHRDLLQTIWGPAHVDDAHYLRIVIARLREKLGDSAADPRLIFNEPGIGYRAASE
ncbi:response regulator [Paracoccus suum]|uniref:Response regulator n=1 Tax=Paracoccus suum TaxID=2259340 RepID=A0A344PN06_9RHOB|nr:response regulator [Paracoccus suum]AXC50761.1 response regulator [Paracoccus suum]